MRNKISNNNPEGEVGLTPLFNDEDLDLLEDSILKDLGASPDELPEE